ncbi:MAG: DUF6174 domain-containing protein [Gemmatimonadaceae bacterium]
MPMRRALAGLALSLAACGLVTGTDSDGDVASLAAAESRWRGAGVQDYQIVVQYSCFCAYTRPVRLTVRFGSVVSRVDAETGQPVPPHGADVRDVAGLFGLVRDAIARPAASLSVRYDPTYGFPTNIAIDYIRNAIDDELSVTTSQFQPLR